VNRAGKIAMKLDEGEGIVDVQICTENDDVLLTTAEGQCIRFAVDGRARVQGPRFDGRARRFAVERRRVISLAILRHIEATPTSAPPISRCAAPVAPAKPRPRPRRGRREEAPPTAPSVAGALCEMSAAEQFILTVSVNGYGKRTSSFEYRVTGRGGKGIVAMAVNERNGKLIASFPVEDERPDHAGHRWRPAHPLPGRTASACRPLDAGRHRLRHGRGRKGRLGRAGRRLT
jgi:DNA gyrase subunit A